MSVYYPDREEQFYVNQKKFSRTSKYKNTLVIEPCGTFWQLIDPAKDNFSFGDDPLYHQLNFTIDNSICVAFIKIWAIELLNQVKLLTKNYEIILFTMLPREILNLIINKIVPELENFVSFSLCYEELIFPEDRPLVYKDMSLLSDNRTINLVKVDDDDEPPEPNMLMVIDILDTECCDNELVRYFHPHPFQGEMKYPNLKAINEFLKQTRKDGIDCMLIDFQDKAPNQEEVEPQGQPDQDAIIEGEDVCASWN